MFLEDPHSFWYLNVKLESNVNAHIIVFHSITSRPFLNVGRFRNTVLRSVYKFSSYHHDFQLQLSDPQLSVTDPPAKKTSPSVSGSEGTSWRLASWPRSWSMVWGQRGETRGTTSLCQISPSSPVRTIWHWKWCEGMDRRKSNRTDQTDRLYLSHVWASRIEEVWMWRIYPNM